MRVESIGKLHYKNDGLPTGFDRQQEPMHIHDGVGLIWGSVRDPMPESAGPSPLFSELGPGESSYNRYDQRIVELGTQWLKERATSPDAKPWTLFLGLVAPHMPLVVPQKYLDLYPLDEIQLPKLLPQDGFHRHPWVDRLALHWNHDAALGTNERRKLAIACYFGLITFLDERIGVLLDVLEVTGLINNTRIIYTADHGDNLGSRGLWNKCTMYRESTGIPMIIAGPGIPSGKTCSTNVSLLDIYPTVIDCVGLEQTEEESDLPGASLFDIASKPDDPERIGFSEYHAVGAVSGAFMLSHGKYKLHYYVGFDSELFDLHSDPEELCDLAKDQRYQGVLADMKKRLLEIVDPERIDREAKRDQNDLVQRFGGPIAVRSMGNQGATPTPEKFIAQEERS